MLFELNSVKPILFLKIGPLLLKLSKNKSGLVFFFDKLYNILNRQPIERIISVKAKRCHDDGHVTWITVLILAPRFFLLR